jgi:hypothetical protein
MLDDAIDTTSTPAQGDAAPIEPTGGDAGEQPQRTFTQAEVDALIKDRLDRAAKKSEEQQRRTQEEAQRRAAEQQGEYKSLYEKTQADLEQARNEAKAVKLAAARRIVAKELGISEKIAERLVGETEEELRADAEALLGELPKPQKPPAPNINAGSGDGKPPSSQPDKLGGLTPAEFAARYNLTVAAVQRYINES